MCDDTVQFCNMLTVIYEVCSESNVQGKITLIRSMLERWRNNKYFGDSYSLSKRLGNCYPLHQELCMTEQHILSPCAPGLQKVSENKTVGRQYNWGQETVNHSNKWYHHNC
jgi:hypothetical protein